MTDHRRVVVDEAWVLQSVWYVTAGSQQGATLQQIIAAGDFIEHAIFNADVLHDGLERLIARGLVAITAEYTFTVTESFQRLITDRGRIAHSSIRKDAELLEALLTEMPLDRNAIKPLPDGLITPERVAEAYRAYIGNRK
ncbi:MAG: hypothetical protein ACYC6A_19300 [Armatimonadota bacterium]